MKRTLGIVRNIDHLGRIVLPMELRKTRNINPGDPVEIYTDGDVICLKPAKATEECGMCGSESHLIKVDGMTICHVCAKKVMQRMIGR